MLTSSSKDLLDMFRPCVDRTIELVAGQITQVRQSGSRVRVSINSSNIRNHELTRFVVRIPVWRLWRVRTSIQPS